MTVIIDISVPADQFALGQLFDRYPDIAVEVERLVPMESGILPLFWVDGADPDAVVEFLSGDPLVLDASVLSETEGRHLFQVLWSNDIDSIVRSLVESGADILRATGTVEAWKFRLHFRTREDMQSFREACRSEDVGFDLLGLYNPTPSTPESDLTEQQLEFVTAAFERGYWHVPRKVTLGELADEYGISDNAASQRIRRGLQTILGNVLSNDVQQTHE
ncbi:bacterio-opsin activator domain-containing protein [Haloarchaeobius sp. TZWWS8]|uniref:helix-turn-helix domain-containing protein n=1 Tax=Haloarchaeobius sp. TZWWS8 TaxID=3446121 RepID=UPI003EBA1443